MHVIKYPRLEDLSAQLQGWKPNFVYVYGGVNGDKRDLEKQAVSHLSFLVDAQGACVHACAGRGRRQGGGGSLQARRVYTRAAACWTLLPGRLVGQRQCTARPALTWAILPAPRAWTGTHQCCGACAAAGRFVEAALHLFLASFGGLHLDTVYFDAQGCTQIGKR